MCFTNVNQFRAIDLEGSAINLSLINNVAYLPQGANSFTMLYCNYYLRNIVVEGNAITGAASYDNFILDYQHQQQEIQGFAKINNNNGKVRANRVASTPLIGNYYNVGEIIVNYKDDSNKTHVGKVCVTSGYWTTNTWKANTSYNVGDIFHINGSVFKVTSNYVSGQTYSDKLDALNVIRIATLAVFKDYGAIV